LGNTTFNSLLFKRSTHRWNQPLTLSIRSITGATRAAQRSGARYLLSEDFQSDRRYQDIQVLNPFEHSPSEFGL